MKFSICGKLSEMGTGDYRVEFIRRTEELIQNGWHRYNVWCVFVGKNIFFLSRFTGWLMRSSKKIDFQDIPKKKNRMTECFVEFFFYFVFTIGPILSG